MKRGDLYYVDPPGFLGKVRPAVIVQANGFNDNPPSVTLCLLTSTLVDSRLRVTLKPSKANGLGKPSQVMIDKVMTLPLDKLANRIGAVTAGVVVWLSSGKSKRQTKPAKKNYLSRF